MKGVQIAVREYPPFQKVLSRRGRALLEEGCEGASTADPRKFSS